MAGQTLTQIREILAASGLSPRHAFGQHFLVDLNLMRKLVGAAQVGAADVVLEVGCGTGSLTECLLETGARVVGVEIDRGLASILTQRLGGCPRFRCMAQDVLASKHAIEPRVLAALGDWEPCAGGERKLVANLPYQVATPLLLNLLIKPVDLSRMVCTVQREVALRLAAAPATAEYGVSSIVAQSFATLEVVARLGPEAFWPRPKVDSTMLVLRPKSAVQIDLADRGAFARFVQSAFAQRRKMLRKQMIAWGIKEPADRLEALAIRPDARPEAVSPADWRRLFQAFHSQRT